MVLITSEASAVEILVRARRLIGERGWIGRPITATTPDAHSPLTLRLAVYEAHKEFEEHLDRLLGQALETLGQAGVVSVISKQEGGLEKAALAALRRELATQFGCQFNELFWRQSHSQVLDRFNRATITNIQSVEKLIDSTVERLSASKEKRSMTSILETQPAT